MNAHAYTHFDNFHMKASRNNEESWKFFLERELKQLGNRARGRSQAQWIITHADAGCASPGEARVLYELCAADLTGMRTQVEVHTRGRRYFIDCGFTARKSASSSTDEPNTGTTPAASTRHFPASASANATSKPRAGTSSASAGTIWSIQTSSLRRSARRSQRAWGETT